MSKKERLSIIEAWNKIRSVLKEKMKDIEEQMPKAIKEYPDVVNSQALKNSYLGFLVNLAIRRGFDFGGYVPDHDELVKDFICGPHCCDCWYMDEGRHKECVDTTVDWMKDEVIPPLGELKTCQDLVNEYKDALMCYSEIDQTRSLEEIVKAVEECNQRVNDAWQTLVDIGCV